MGVMNVKQSFVMSAMLSVLIFSLMQMNRQWFLSSQVHTILGGYLGSVLFTLILTALGNMETLLFGPRFHTKLFPEVVIAFILAVVASGMVHRVCTTTCCLFSALALYYTNKASKQAYPTPVATTTVSSKRRK